LLAAAGLSGQGFGPIYPGWLAARISHRKTLRPVLHGELCPLRIVLRFLARRADPAIGYAGTKRIAPGEDPGRVRL